LLETPFLPELTVNTVLAITLDHNALIDIVHYIEIEFIIEKQGKSIGRGSSQGKPSILSKKIFFYTYSQFHCKTCIHTQLAS